MLTKAVIPIAGTGSRMMPLSSVIPKAMLPLPCSDTSMLPVVHWILAEARSCGIEDALLIISPSQREIVERYLDQVPQDAPPRLPRQISLTVQEKPRGFGDAVARGEDFVGKDPFMLLLGDHVYLPQSDTESCSSQVRSAFEKHQGAAMIGVQAVGCDELPRVGVPAGDPIRERTYRCTDFVEKPDQVTASKRLRTPGLGDAQFLAHCGIYVFTPEIFQCLSQLSPGSSESPGKELQLADAQSLLLERHGNDYFLYRIEGRAYDTGTPQNYAKAVAAFAEKRLQA